MYVVKRGLISSDVIHTVTSHYFQSAQSPPYSLSPLLPPHFLFLSFYVTLFPCYTFGTTHLHTRLLFFYPPSLLFCLPQTLPLSSSWFYFILLPLTLISPFITSTFLSLSTLSITFPMVDILNSFVFTLRAQTHQQKEFKIYISKISFYFCKSTALQQHRTAMSTISHKPSP